MGLLRERERLIVDEPGQGRSHTKCVHTRLGSGVDTLQQHRERDTQAWHRTMALSFELSGQCKVLCVFIISCTFVKHHSDD